MPQPTQTFEQFIASRRKLYSSDAKERRLGLIETEALEIAHRELKNARTLAQSLGYVNHEDVSLDNLLQLQSLLSSLYPIAYHELVDRGEIERPVVTAEPARAVGPVGNTGN